MTTKKVAASYSPEVRERAVRLVLEDGGDRLFALLRLPPSQWKSARTTNAFERLHEMGYPGQRACGGFFATAA